MNVEIGPKGVVSSDFLIRGVSDFQAAIQFVRQWRYGRNKDKRYLISLFEDSCGTCSTKHALLKILADENGFGHVQLFMGIFKMGEDYSSKLQTTLRSCGLSYIPEAHCYLKINGEIVDATTLHSEPDNFIPYLLEEKEIQADQIDDFKIKYHQEYLQKWLDKNLEIKFSAIELWAIREQLIQDLET